MSPRWPLIKNEIRDHSVSNTFGMVRRYPNGALKAHQGWDLSAVVGTPCYAIADGEVAFAGDAGDFGLIVVHSFQFTQYTYYAAYAHLQDASVKKGDAVRKGQLIGHTGKSGNASNLPTPEYHLHFEIRATPLPGLGLGGRVSPYAVYGVCPLNEAIDCPLEPAAPKEIAHA